MNEFNEDKEFFYYESDKLRKYFKDKTHIEFNHGRFWLEGKLMESPQIGMQKAKDFPFLEKDERTLNLWTREGHISLVLTHKQIIDLKRAIFVYEALHLEKALSLVGKEITPKMMRWNLSKYIK